MARVLRGAALNRLANLEPAKPVERYEYDRPGGCCIWTSKSLAASAVLATASRGSATGPRGAGWKYVHVAIDDHSRLAFSAIFADETGQSACAALLQALRDYASLGILFERVLIDNCSCYKSWRFLIGLHNRRRPGKL